MDNQDRTGKKKVSPARSLGCMAFSLLTALSLLAGGGWLMQGWDQAGALQRVGAIVLLVIGSVMLLPLLIVTIAMIVMRVIAGKLQKSLEEIKKPITDAVGQIAAMNADLYGEIHEFRNATDADFEGLDRAYYDQMMSELTGRGFRHLGDLIDTTIEQKMNNRTPIRVFTAEGGTTQVAVYHLVAHGKSLQIREAATELSDGTFLMTSNTQGLDLMTMPEKLQKEQCAVATPLADLLDRHEQRKSELLKATPGLVCVVINTLEEAIACEKRQQLIKNEFRKGTGYTDPNEVRRIGEAGGNADAGEAIAQEMEQQKKEQ